MTDRLVLFLMSFAVAAAAGDGGAGEEGVGELRAPWAFLEVAVDAEGGAAGPRPAAFTYVAGRIETPKRWYKTFRSPRSRETVHEFDDPGRLLEQAGRLPAGRDGVPAGRRVVVRVRDGGRVRTAVYDRTRLPDAMHDLFAMLSVSPFSEDEAALHETLRYAEPSKRPVEAPKPPGR